MNLTTEAGVIPSLPFVLRPRESDETMREHVRSALGRKLPEAFQAGRSILAHDRVLSIAGGGPSLTETYRSLSGVVVACNHSLTFLLERGVTPWACGIMDPGEHMAALIEPRKGVFYFVASNCHPRLFDRLSGCQVILWHALQLPELEEILDAERPAAWKAIGGPSSIGLRWVPIGYEMGFRTFHMHGVDSSYRGGERYAYSDDGAPKYHTLTVDGFLTSPNLFGQLEEFGVMVERFKQSDTEPTTIEVFGDGLLPNWWRRRQQMQGGA